MVNVHLKNVGKSAALKAITHRHVLFRTYMGQFHTEPPDREEGSAAIAQSSEIVTTTVSLKDTFSNESVDVQPSDLINWDGSGILVFGRITYEDASGFRYCTPYAYDYLNGSWGMVTSIDRKVPPLKISITELCSGVKPY